MNKDELKRMILEILEEEASNCSVKKVSLQQVAVTELDRLDTGSSDHRVYTKDLFSLQESPRLGCGIMEMEQTTFLWKLDYDEIDYIISGSLTVHCGQSAVTAGPGEVILIPKGSAISFSAQGHTRFLYVTFPADWQKQ